LFQKGIKKAGKKIPGNCHYGVSGYWVRLSAVNLVLIIYPNLSAYFIFCKVDKDSNSIYILS